jgi:hypothetical protein
MTRIGVIEVAPNTALTVLVIDAVKRFGPATSYEIANWSYFRRKPKSSRLGDRWQANAAEWSAARRAIARLRHRGLIRIVGRDGRASLYDISHGGRS